MRPEPRDPRGASVLPVLPGGRGHAGPGRLDVSISPRLPVTEEPQPPPSDEPPPLLLVEDDAGDALLVEELLADSGLKMRLLWARSLDQARDLLAANSPRCVLLDLHLPDAHGLQALGTLRQQASHIPVVVLTGLAEESAGLDAVAAGAQDYLVKGKVEPDLFGRTVRYAMQRKQAEQVSAALQASRIHAQENARLERGLLPVPLLRGAGDVDVVARYRPGRAQTLLGGDFYDVVQLADGSVHALIGDVSGHGPDEAALGVGLRIAWRTLVINGTFGPRQLDMLQELLIAERPGGQVFATVTSLVLSPDRRAATVLRAGHPGMLVRSPAGVDLVVPPGGPALGLLPGVVVFTVHEMELPPDAEIVLFTDGLYEGRVGPAGERLGEDGLLALAREAAGLPPQEFVDTLLRRAEALSEDYGGLADDVALVHLQWSKEADTTR
ncbi:PP2C family protein-serine/threonine phosphatase [Microbispora sp. ATCC PTA-5024]|uniref:PP2C family protein-serine/threonine phosphatase n=1 Tax=Microbispora sp. ATCC PTA-5024 TaxID=316330 RepID=UPI001E6459CB|nr:fused response regulator/phosphatase [Microbispora sp. ATCC PTA-5024]